MLRVVFFVACRDLTWKPYPTISSSNRHAAFNFFLYMPIENQLQALLSKYEPVKKSGAVQSHNLNSVLSGNVVKNNLSQGNTSDTGVTLIWNTDAAPVFSSSKKSIWPLQACVNEIGPRCKDNLPLVWQTKAMATYFYEALCRRAATSWIQWNGLYKS